MKRIRYTQKRSIISKAKHTIKEVILLPIKLVLLPFKLLGETVFYLSQKDKTINEIHLCVESLTKDISFMKKQIDGLIKSRWDDNIKINKTETDINELNLSQDSLIKDLVDLSITVRQLKDNEPIDLGNFHLINTSDETEELKQIEAEMLGSSVAKEEYDWHRERKLVQHKMKLND